jgi:hypothetical protein
MALRETVEDGAIPARAGRLLLECAGQRIHLRYAGVEHIFEQARVGGRGAAQAFQVALADVVLAGKLHDENEEQKGYEENNHPAHRRALP